MKAKALSKHDILNLLLQGAVIMWMELGYVRKGKTCTTIGNFELNYPNHCKLNIGLRQGRNITSQWCYYDETSKSYKLTEPARLLLTKKTT